jgi:hypothetical protein
MKNLIVGMLLCGTMLTVVIGGDAPTSRRFDAVDWLGFSLKDDAREYGEAFVDTESVTPEERARAIGHLRSVLKQIQAFLPAEPKPSEDADGAYPEPGTRRVEPKPELESRAPDGGDWGGFYDRRVRARKNAPRDRDVQTGPNDSD